MKPVRNKRDLFFGLLQAMSVLCTGLQWLISPDSLNMACVGLVATSSAMVFAYLWRANVTVDYPISSVAILGQVVTTQFAALVAQTLAWTPLVELLRWPLMTFSVLALVQLLTIAAHWVYRHLAVTNTISESIRQRMLMPIGALSVPPVHVIWVMALPGLYAMALGGGAAIGDVGGKAIQALNFLVYLPFLIPLYYRQYGSSYCNIKRHGPLLLMYVLVMMVVAIALNARQLMAIGPVQIGLIFLIYALQDPKPITQRTVVKLGMLIAVSAVAISMFADLSTAMVIMRDKRDALKPKELVEETVKTLGDRSRLKQYNLDVLDQVRYARYDEVYLLNPVIARFSETKFHDNHIYFASIINDRERDELWATTLEKMLVILPQPVLDLFDSKIDKYELMYSFGDFYRYLQEGPDNTLGGYSIGSGYAHLIALVGMPWFPVCIVLLLMPTFVVLDSFARQAGRLEVAPVIMCWSWMIFLTALNGESLVSRMGLYLRDLPQKLVLYVVVYGLVKYGFMLFKSSVRSDIRVR